MLNRFHVAAPIYFIREWTMLCSREKWVVPFGWGEAADEPAREDARPTEIANCTTTEKWVVS